LEGAVGQFFLNALLILKFCILKAKTQFYLVLSSLGLGASKYPIAPPLATLLMHTGLTVFLNIGSKINKSNRGKFGGKLCRSSWHTPRRGTPVEKLSSK